MFKSVPEAWREYRFRNIISTAGLLLGFPLVVVVSIAFKLWSPNYAASFFVALMVIWTAFWGWSAFRVVRWPCPRCGKAWLANQELEIGAERRCSSCGLSLYESP